MWSRRLATTVSRRFTAGWGQATAVPAPASFRPFSSNASGPLDAFRDPVDRQNRGTEPVGRSWTVKELRRKSYDDLHKLWYVLYKEKNMLLTEQQLSRRRQLVFPQPQRFRKVQKSMGAIKQVLGERKIQKIAEHQTRIQEEMQAEAEMDDDNDIEIEIDDTKKGLDK
jgi:large subunit ribosomal protein L47